MKAIPGGHNLFVADVEVVKMIENLYNKFKVSYLSYLLLFTYICIWFYIFGPFFLNIQILFEVQAISTNVARLNPKIPNLTKENPNC